MINKIIPISKLYRFMLLVEISIMLIWFFVSFSFSKYAFKEEFVAFKIQDEIQNENVQMKNNIDNKSPKKVDVEVNKDDMSSLIEVVTIKH